VRRAAPVRGRTPMPKPVRLYVHYVDRFNYAVGRIAMYLIFAMMGVLLMSSIFRATFNVSFIWVVEMAQFMLTAYYILGGPYSLQLDSHVRMDLLYGRWSDRTRAVVDAITICFLIFYLAILLMGGISSTEYAIKYGQQNQSAWAPQLWPIKVLMTVGIFMMLLQAIAIFFRNLARARGETLA
jgi:TRAP-type mannitol/chloroaromatic compound transport system permease small subunit